MINIKKSFLNYITQHLIATPAQRSSLATVPLMPMIKRISPPSTASYLPFARYIPKNNIGRNMNIYLDKDEYNRFSLHNLLNRKMDNYGPAPTQKKKKKKKKHR